MVRFFVKEQEISGCKSLGSVHVFNMLQMINIHASGAVHTMAHILQEGNGDVVPTYPFQSLCQTSSQSEKGGEYLPFSSSSPFLLLVMKAK